MFVTMHSFRARPGEEDAVVALHEDWVAWRPAPSEGLISGELLCAAGDSRAFLRIVRYESEVVARKAEAQPEYAAWFRRLMSLAEAQPARVHYRIAWSDR
jgi:Antibiotic biosynthesis monooxygenase